MSETTFYARIIKEDDLDVTNGTIDGDVTEYTGLAQIELPWNNSTSPYTEEIHLIYPDRTVESVSGHLLGSGKE